VTFVETLRALGKRWWIILVMLALGIAGARLLTDRAAPIYEASVTFFVSTPGEINASQNFSGDQFAASRVNSYVRLLSSDRVAEAVKAAGVDLSLQSISGSITGSADVNTVLLTATVRNPSKADALAIAQALGTEFGGVVHDIDAQARGADPATLPAGTPPTVGIEINVTSGPSVRSTPVSPRPTVNMMIGVLAGLVIGVAIALLLEIAKTTVTSVDQLHTVGEVPVLGEVPAERRAKKVPLIADVEFARGRVEAIRKIRTNLQFASVDTPIQVLAVSSALPGEGKSTTAFNLGVMSAESGMRVLVIDCDLRHPRLATYAGIADVSGLTDLLSQRVAIDDVVQSWGTKGLRILPAGTVPPNPSELLGSRVMADLVGELRTHYDLILIDTPPLVPFTDAAVAVAFADGFAITVRFNKTSRAHVQQALASLRAVDARIVGTVLTMVRTPRRNRDNYAYNYTKRAAETKWPSR
jgi:capsular exopolysaccharide synthesis family protein